jgi:hypothetical protein
VDTFETTLQEMKKMAPEEQKAVMEEKKAMCTCPTCPSYTTCAKNGNELMFCATGKSFMCIPYEKGCICPTCPVAKDLGLKYSSFCTRGSEKAQRYENTLWGSKMV